MGTSNMPLSAVLRRLVGFMRFARRAVRATASSVFLVRDGAPISLIGVKSDWDWTRTSFATRVTSWPTAERALTSGEVVILARKDASGLEAEWFGPRGIVRTACVPLCIGEQHLGAMFFDFDQEERSIDTVYLAEVGRRCARALNRPPARSYRDRWSAAAKTRRA